MSLNDQFEMGRIPLKPLPYSNKALAQCNEILIDYAGDDPKYHIYIADSSDPTKLIDITNYIIKEAFGNEITINIEGLDEPQPLQDLINFIYKRFMYPHNPIGFSYERDADKMMDPNNTKTVLFRDVDAVIYFPVTMADSVFDKTGKTIQERLDKMTRLGFAIDYTRVYQENQNTFEFSYPFLNYPLGGNSFEVRVGTTYVDKSRYQVQDLYDENNNIYGARITFFADRFELNRRIDFCFLYNATDAGDGDYTAFSGAQIVNKSISSAKLEKISDSYTLPDSTCVASSKAVNDLFSDFMNSNATNNGKILWAFDSSTNQSNIVITSNDQNYKNILDNINANNDDPVVLNIVTASEKNTYVDLVIEYTGSGASNVNLGNIKQLDGSTLPSKIPANKLIRILIDTRSLIPKIISNNSAASTSKWIYTCQDQETIISFTGLAYEYGDKIDVYRNGVRLFQDLDYILDSAQEIITLFVRTEEGERIVFESTSNN